MRLKLLRPVAQLRELIHSGRSVNSLEEDQDDCFLTSELTEVPRLARGILQREIGSWLSESGTVDAGQIIIS
jgi:hypothetical protein